MKKISVMLMLTCMSCMFVRAQDVTSINSTTINSVKVFLTGAQVNRNAKVNVEAGERVLAIKGLSQQIDQGSINVTGTGNAMIMGVSFRIDYLNDNIHSPELTMLKDSLEFLTASQRKTALMQAVYNDEINLLKANQATGGANTGVNPENLKKVMDYFHSKMIDLRGKLNDLNEQAKKTNERIEKINQQITDLNGKLNQPSGTILVTVNAKQPTSLDLNISYYVNGAGWTPFYDLRAENINSPAKLTYKASVFQSTGEEWKNVKLSLSSGNPVLGGNKPELYAWYLNFYEPVRIMMAPQMKKDMQIEGAYQRDEAQSITANNATVLQNQLETEFDIPLSYTIASNGKATDVEIQTSELKASYSYSATPKMDKDAFLMAGITGWEQLNLLPGKANVYFENSYVGESYINPGMTEDTFKLSMGRDRRIIIKREQVKELTSTKFIGSNTEKKFVYEISVRNTKKDAVELTVEDQIPIAQNADIKVNIDDLAKGQLNQETGKVTWRISVKPGEVQKIRFSFTVKYPKGKSITNL